MGTVIYSQQRGSNDRTQRWDRLERADLFERYGDLHAQGSSQRQAAKELEVPRTTLQAWRAYQERLDECPSVVEFFQSVPGLAFLHRLVLAIHLVCTEVGACGIKPRHNLLYASASFRRLDLSPSKLPLSQGDQWLNMLSCTTTCSVLAYRRPLTLVDCSRREITWIDATRSPLVRRATIAAPETAISLEAGPAWGGTVPTILED